LRHQDGLQKMRASSKNIKKGSNHGLWLLMDPTDGRDVFSKLIVGKVRQIIKRVVMSELAVLH
jgi:hypothetical protein